MALSSLLSLAHQEAGLSPHLPQPCFLNVSSLTSEDLVSLGHTKHLPAQSASRGGGPGWTIQDGSPEIHVVFPWC